MKVAYQRVSTQQQELARQTRAFEAMLNYIREDDVVVVESISRIARNTKDLLSIIDTITAKGADFVSLKESIDTSTPQGKFVLTVFGAMAELERECILQRTREGIAIAKEQHKYKGKPKMKIDEAALRRECKKWRDGLQTAREAMQRLELKPNTFYRRVNELGL